MGKMVSGESVLRTELELLDPVMTESLASPELFIN